jgi:hypothetical protein
MTEDYELVPMGPIRRLEKKMEDIERISSPDATRGLVEVVKSNQTIVDEMIKVNSDLIDRVTKMMESVDALSENMKDFIERLEVSSEDGGADPEKSEKAAQMEEKMKKLEKKLNALILTTMPNLKMKRG